ncbi:MAG: HupE/UreJ family protein [Acidobacteriota bacterium]
MIPSTPRYPSPSAPHQRRPSSLSCRNLWRSLWSAGLLALLLLAAPFPADAHNMGESYLYLQIYEDTVTGRFEIALSDYNFLRGLVGTPQEITPENFAEKVHLLEAYYREKVRLSDDSGPLTLEFRERALLGTMRPYAQLSFDLGGLQKVPEQITVEYSVLFDDEPSHRGFLLVEHDWSTGTFSNEGQVSLEFAPDSRRQVFELPELNLLNGFLAVVGLGWDRLWEGVDHVFFLLALLLAAVLIRKEEKPTRELAEGPIEEWMSALSRIAKITAAFLLAHSFTLALASLGILSLPLRPVEVLIAASVALAALNLLVPFIKDRIWWFVVGFGLIHGFGLAGTLAKMGILVEKRGLATLGFNLGFETGLLLIVAVITPLLLLVRRWSLFRKVAVPAIAVGMLLLSAAWMAERALDIDIPIRETLPDAIEQYVP